MSAAWRAFCDPNIIQRRGFVIDSESGGPSRLQIFLKRLIAWPLLAGIGFLILTLALERMEFMSNDPAILNEAVKGSLLRFHSIIIVVSELGFAFIIAWVVSLAIEAGAKREQTFAIKNAISSISKDVFSGAFSIGYEKDYIKSIIDTCLNQPLVREGYKLHYRIEQFPPDEADKLGIDRDRFVLVKARMAYDVKNCGRQNEPFRITYGIPCRTGQLREISRVTSLTIGNERYTSAADVERFEISHEQIEPDLGANANDRNYRFELELAPAELVPIAIEAVLVKELSDADTFGFFKPTSGLNIRITNTVPGLIFGVQPRTSSEMRRVGEADQWLGEWQIDGSILPYQSVNLWWRSPEDNGQAAALATVVTLPEAETVQFVASETGSVDQPVAVKAHFGRRLLRLLGAS